MTGQSKEASLTTLMMTDHVRREADRTMFFNRKSPHDTYVEMISASWGGHCEPHVLGCLRTPTPPQTSPSGPSGVCIM